jgi:hypothetical protein
LSVRLVVSPECLTKRGENSPVWGEVWLTDDEFAFPGPRWTDMAAAFCVAWNQSLQELENGSKKTVEVSFMDGPYKVDLRLSEGSVQIKMIDSHREDEVIRMEMGSIQDLRENALTVAKSILEVARQNQWTDADIEKLATISKSALQ